MIEQSQLKKMALIVDYFYYYNRLVTVEVKFNIDNNTRKC